MKINRVVIGTFALALIATASASHEGQKAGDSDLKLASIPWDPPKSTVNPDYVRMAKLLLGNGLGDPRGGKFSRVTVKIGNATGFPQSPQEAVGWVLSDNKHAVLLDGITYKIEAVKGRADLEKTIAGNDPTEKPKKGTFRISPNSDGVPSAAITAATPALLLLAGRPDFAQKAYALLSAQASESPGYTLILELYQRLQMQVAQCLIDRQDQAGQTWAHQLLMVSTIRDREKVVSRFPNNTPMMVPLDLTKQIYADMVRRAAHPKKEPVDLIAASKMEPKARIAFYMNSLDAIAGRQWSQPGGIDFTQDPLYQAIRAEGQNAVPGLIEAIGSDHRLTRSVSFWRDFFPYRSIHSVREVAQDLLSEIWPASDKAKDSDPVIMAQELRKSWSKVAGLTGAERSVATLADDKAGSRAWLEASRYLVSPEGDSPKSYWVRPVQKDGVPIRGEKLRTSSVGGRVTTLMAMRALQVANTPTQNVSDLSTCQTALRIGDCLAVWAPSKSPGTLARVSRISVAKAAKDHDGMFPAVVLGEAFAQLSTDRLLQGDRSAITDYDEFISGMAIKTWVPVGTFRPFWTFPQDPQVQAVAKGFLNKQKATLASTNLKDAMDIWWYFVERTLNSPVLEMLPYRKALAAGIANDIPAGEAWTTKTSPGNVTFKCTTGLSGGAQLGRAVPDQAPEKHIAVSFGDWLAQSVSKVDGAPEFCMTWEPKRRKEAKMKLEQWLLDDLRDWRAIAKASPLYSENY